MSVTSLPMWPRPAPRFPNGMPPAVLELPAEEQREFDARVVNRYVETVASYQQDALRFALKGMPIEDVDDAELGRLFVETLYAKYLNPKLNPADLAAFAGVLAKADGTREHWKADASAMGLIEPYPGVQLASSVLLLERLPDAFAFRPIAIRVGALVVEPEHGEAWALAKTFLLNGIAHQTLSGFHGLLHFPMDAVNAVSRCLLPDGHPLLRLIFPHTYLSLALNRRVLEHPRSLLMNSPSDPYGGLGGTEHGVRTLISLAYRGLAGNSSYPAWRWPERPRLDGSQFYALVDVYYTRILAFVREVIALTVTKGDPLVTEWARHLSSMLPGFPSPEELWDGETLASVVAFYIADVSVMHAADHIGLAAIPIARRPFRLRIAPPASTDIPKWSRSKAAERDDIFRHKMCDQMYIRPWNLALLADVRYGFNDRRLDGLNEDFLASLAEGERTFVGPKAFALADISRSIHY